MGDALNNFIHASFSSNQCPAQQSMPGSIATIISSAHWPLSAAHAGDAMPMSIEGWPSWAQPARPQFPLAASLPEAVSHLKRSACVLSGPTHWFPPLMFIPPTHTPPHKELCWGEGAAPRTACSCTCTPGWRCWRCWMGRAAVHTAPLSAARLRTRSRAGARALHSVRARSSAPITTLGQPPPCRDPGEARSMSGC